MGYFNVRSLWPQNPHVAGSRGVPGVRGRRSWPCGNRMLPAGVSDHGGSDTTQTGTVQATRAI